ncbi:MAG TPA: ATP synthase F0 subunit B [Cryomorphaceae bacterium]|jgi:F-type H+-transporting ATPase subunit b|nr:ATP synthase F0 subunit B [Cryomorphaceae bacterium]
MGIVTPGFGLIFWTTLTFFLLLFLLAKFAWKPILKAVQDREGAIDLALKAAEAAKAEMASLQSNNEQLLKQTREEREQILKEARVLRDKTIADAKTAASEEAAKVLESARIQINNEKMAAMTEVKNQVAQLAIDMSERILRAELKDAAAQKAMVDRAMQDVKLN